ncbi:hypothetical protein GOP47_0024913 [Adiantum capillus-veneris]|uniref:Uncharacterized protein n=1 Tax=Adiantum capillus-veneris TaxID=13818 RepID=A0A9D4U2Z6_ADICA|nr:hypothetical protein GOP47_0031240 [Adiantum capillus-veneris]KAI5060493.1 hypothetical protein GOP47_0024913 [Adiantum capillus-veneris]
MDKPTGHGHGKDRSTGREAGKERPGMCKATCNKGGGEVDPHRIGSSSSCWGRMAMLTTILHSIKHWRAVELSPFHKLQLATSLRCIAIFWASISHVDDENALAIMNLYKCAYTPRGCER